MDTKNSDHIDYSFISLLQALAQGKDISEKRLGGYTRRSKNCETNRSIGTDRDEPCPKNYPLRCAMEWVDSSLRGAVEREDAPWKEKKRKEERNELRMGLNIQGNTAKLSSVVKRKLIPSSFNT